MATATEYRSIAEQQRVAAEECRLGLVRDLHLSSAARFSAMAEELARYEGQGPMRSDRQVFY